MSFFSINQFVFEREIRKTDLFANTDEIKKTRKYGPLLQNNIQVSLASILIVFDGIFLSKYLSLKIDSKETLANENV